MDDKHAEDAAFAAAVCLLEFLPTLFLLSRSDQFDHLATAIGEAISDYCDGARGWFIPDPSPN